MKKVLFNSMICLVIVATVGTIVSCNKDKENTGTSGGGVTPAEYVDLGLPSGTKWKTINETNQYDLCDFYTLDEAMQKFGSALPTKEQLEELRTYCQWTWNDTKKGYKVVGPNGKSIFLSAAGYSNCSGEVYTVVYGYYLSSTPDGSGSVWTLYFDSGGVAVNCGRERCYGQSVRLAQN